jgi:hypothetical protein
LMVAVPDVGGMKFRKRLIVVLPAPFRAEQTKYLAGSNLQVETSSAVLVPYFLVRPAAASIWGFENL